MVVVVVGAGYPLNSGVWSSRQMDGIKDKRGSLGILVYSTCQMAQNQRQKPESLFPPQKFLGFFFFMHL